MNRADRRKMLRIRTGKPRPLCAPGTHRFGEVRATVAGETVTRRVICATCRRPFQQVMQESPEDLAIYRAWLEDELAKARAQHRRECPRRHDLAAAPVEDCVGCDREGALRHSTVEELG